MFTILNRQWVVASLLWSTLSNPLGAAEPMLTSNTDTSPFTLVSSPKEKRGFLISPLISFLIAGFDQWWEGQYLYAGIYTGFAAGSLVYSHSTSNHRDRRHQDLAGHLYPLAGGMSMYHAFRSAVKSRQAYGEFTFLKHEETPSEVALSPFHLSYLGRVTTLIPVGIGIGIGLLGFSSADRDFSQSHLSALDVYFATGLSYQAGVWEEAVFRGTLMPIGRHYTNSDLASNLLSSALFGAAHLRSGFIPWPQFLFGLYMGHLTQTNEWRIGEAIFIHSWYDFFLFLGDYLKDGTVNSVKLPTFQLHF